METNVLSGLLLILLAGSCSGVFSVPFKFNRGWAWENNWFIWSFAALLVMPWLMAWLTVPRLGTLYGADPHSTSLVALFGLTWGVGAILFGKGIDYLGISLSLPIMQGLINSIGTLMPIVLRDPSELATPAGLRILAGVAVILAGIILFALAGSRKEQSEGSRQTGAQSRSRFRKGLVICLLAGIFGPMINFAFVYGAPLQQQAVALGADPVYAGNAVWSDRRIPDQRRRMHPAVPSQPHVEALCIASRTWHHAGRRRRNSMVHEHYALRDGRQPDG